MVFVIKKFLNQFGLSSICNHSFTKDLTKKSSSINPFLDFTEEDYLFDMSSNIFRSQTTDFTKKSTFVSPPKFNTNLRVFSIKFVCYFQLQGCDKLLGGVSIYQRSGFKERPHVPRCRLSLVSTLRSHFFYIFLFIIENSLVTTVPCRVLGWSHNPSPGDRRLTPRMRVHCLQSGHE